MSSPIAARQNSRLIELNTGNGAPGARVHLAQTEGDPRIPGMAHLAQLTAQTVDGRQNDPRDLAALVAAMGEDGSIDPIKFEAHRLVLHNESADGADIQGLVDALQASPEFDDNGRELVDEIRGILTGSTRDRFNDEIDARNIHRGWLEAAWEGAGWALGQAGQGLASAVTWTDEQISDGLAAANRYLDSVIAGEDNPALLRAGAWLLEQGVGTVQGGYGAIKGAAGQAFGILGEFVDLGVLAYNFTTNSDYRDVLLGMARAYASEVAEDPSKPVDDIRDAAGAALDQWEEEYQQALEEGREQEFLGSSAGAVGIELVAALVPISKLGKFGRVAQILDRITPDNLGELGRIVDDLAGLMARGGEFLSAGRQALSGMIGLSRQSGNLTDFVRTVRNSGNIGALLDVGDLSAPELTRLLRSGDLTPDEAQRGLDALANGGVRLTTATSRLTGEIGELRATIHLMQEGFTDIATIRNNSGHGIDLVARDPSGDLVFIEVKSTVTDQAGGLSAAQRGTDFVTSRLEMARLGRGRWENVDPETQALAEALLEELDDAGSVSAIKIDVYLDGQGQLRTPPGQSGGIVTTEWDQDF